MKDHPPVPVNIPWVRFWRHSMKYIPLTHPVKYGLLKCVEVWALHSALQVVNNESRIFFMSSGGITVTTRWPSPVMVQHSLHTTMRMVGLWPVTSRQACQLVLTVISSVGTLRPLVVLELQSQWMVVDGPRSALTQTLMTPLWLSILVSS